MQGGSERKCFVGEDGEMQWSNVNSTCESKHILVIFLFLRALVLFLNFLTLLFCFYSSWSFNRVGLLLESAW